MDVSVVSCHTLAVVLVDWNLVSARIDIFSISPLQHSFIRSAFSAVLSLHSPRYTQLHPLSIPHFSTVICAVQQSLFVPLSLAISVGNAFCFASCRCFSAVACMSAECVLSASLLSRLPQCPLACLLAVVRRAPLPACLSQLAIQ